MTDPQPGAAGADGRLRAEALLAAYPDLTPHDLAALQRWFTAEASALDVAMVASNDRIAGAYRAFRAVHVDRFTAADLLRAAAFLLAVGAVIAALLWRAM